MPEVIPVVIYNGARPWDGPTQISVRSKGPRPHIPSFYYWSDVSLEKRTKQQSVRIYSDLSKVQIESGPNKPDFRGDVPEETR